MHVILLYEQNKSEAKLEAVIPKESEAAAAIVIRENGDQSGGWEMENMMMAVVVSDSRVRVVCSVNGPSNLCQRLSFVLAHHSSACIYWRSGKLKCAL